MSKFIQSTESTFRLYFYDDLLVFLDCLTATDGITNEEKLIIKCLQDFSLQKVLSPTDKNDFLQNLAFILLNQQTNLLVIKHFPYLLPELFLRSKEIVFKECCTDLVEAILNTSLLLCRHNELTELIKNLLQWIQKNNFNFLEYDNILDLYLTLVLELNVTCGVPVNLLCEHSHLIPYTKHKYLKTRWLVYKVLGKFLNVVDLDSYLKEHLLIQDIHVLYLSVSQHFSQENEFGTCKRNLTKSVTGKSLFFLEKSNFVGHYIPINNAFVESQDNLTVSFPIGFKQNVVFTETFTKGLKSVVFAVQSKLPVLLFGGGGCGKTILLEYLAFTLGYKGPPSFLKLQLGNQIDSKSLLGMYVCSDKPGEFIWQPGTLTQAVLNGSWVLLEDIDMASSEVISTLIDLIKTKSLSIPGLGDEIKLSSKFQLFATTRLGQQSLSQNQSSMLYLFSKLCYLIDIGNPNKEELIQTVELKMPNLATVASKMVDIYCMVSSDEALESENDIKTPKLNSSSRKSTPRDLLKWCMRVSNSFTNSGKVPTQEHIFLNALHCFCSSIGVSQDRSVIAFSIGAKLGLTKEKVEYYLTKYKPAVSRTELIFKVGNTQILKYKSSDINLNEHKQKFSFTQHSLRLIENIAEGIVGNEPILLVGETGCGKTACIQFLAEQCGRKVNAVNMSQQSDIADLLGGFKPMDLKLIVRPVKEKFVNIFLETYSRKQNIKFLGHLEKCYTEQKWTLLVKLIDHCCRKALERKQKADENDDQFEELRLKWKSMTNDLNSLESKLKTQEGIIFNFVEGALVNAIKDGEWILLDEINLATSETLECLSGLLDSESGSMVLTERGDIEPIKRHANFRIFGCMNPATDVGKKDLPYGIRNRFTEIYVDEITDEADLKTLVAFYLKDMNLSSVIIEGIVNFYQKIRHQAKETLMDSSGHRPHFSLRTLCRGLQYAADQSSFSPLRAVYEGLCMSFLTQLDRTSYPMVVSGIKKHVFSSVRNIASILAQPLLRPSYGGVFVNVQGYWLSVGPEKITEDKNYVLTESVKKNLKDLARVAAGRRYPVLLQGETSVGKTSLIMYLSRLTGNHCVRINNHEHTDIQEYIGCYGADDNGNLTFKEGVLVNAVRKGYWIILDELNLAPTDVLEALNRLLDDNRELFIAETQETIKAHPSFMLFATQNPPGHYGGRKMLSRAFRNRFVELHFDEIPSTELQEILHQRCDLPVSYCKKFVKVMLDLQLRRRNTGIFAGKNSFMTLRDLFRWAERYRLSVTADKFYDWEQCICEDGFMLIAGRCRQADESQIIQEILEDNFKKKIITSKLFNGESLSSKFASTQLLNVSIEEFQHIVWTENMKRLAVLAGRALRYGEAVLLVGETGCGKTTLCQLYAKSNNAKLYSVNCHMHTESADFLGGLRPSRAKESGEQRLFEWCDGPLVNAMREGELFLIDEISLADDSVLERLNSVLETERMLVLSEKGEVSDKKGSIDIIQAEESFRLIATMNPGGDFGKKELSPALRNRFTEIWCSPSDSYSDLIIIIEHNIKAPVRLNLAISGIEGSGFGYAMVEFLKWFKNTEIGKRFTISIRDLLSWVEFINKVFLDSNNKQPDFTLPSKRQITAEDLYVHGACLVFIDAIGSGNSSQFIGVNAEEIKNQCINFLLKQLGMNHFNQVPEVYENENMFCIFPFHIRKGSQINQGDEAFTINAKTTLKNALRLLRGLQLTRPILLEGSPGVGKTSLVMAVARMSGNPIVRINLSEETDVSDLFGADLPVEGAEGGVFAWRDGPLLKALKAGHWVVFDELNLASQSVLEGLNACFDHRAEVYIPELNKSFQVNKEQTKIFACQNPFREGGGRKGLPKSFLNRFSKVYVESMTQDDFLQIISQAYKTQSMENIKKMVELNELLHREILEQGRWGRKGSPWEFNVRDMMRWCELLKNNETSHPGDFVGLVYQDRMRTFDDKEKVMVAYKRIFPADDNIILRQRTRLCNFTVAPTSVQIGHSKLPRKETTNSPVETGDQFVLRFMLPYLESVMKCVEMKWPSILVGSESSSKNTIVQVLSEITGNKLDVLAMNSGMDTSDFIGGFEQVNPLMCFKDDCQKLLEIINKCLYSLRSSEYDDVNKNILFFKHEVISLKQEALQCKNLEDLRFRLDGVIIKLEGLLSNSKENLAAGNLKFMLFEDTVNSINTLSCNISTNKNNNGQFHWVDGLLVNALKKGHWLLIDNVNFCSSSVLDRLNGLLEPGGVLSIDERGTVDGQITTVKPHENFRIFMSLDPRFGEISRAMRNRGIEIYIPSEIDGAVLDEIDLLLMLRSKKVIDPFPQTLLINVHTRCREENSQLTYSKLLQAAEVTSSLLSKGLSLADVMTEVVSQIYHRNDKLTEIIEEINSHATSNRTIHSIAAHCLSKSLLVKSYTNSLEMTRCYHDSIPYQIHNESDIVKSSTALLLFIEKTLILEMDFRMEFLKRIKPDVHLSKLIAELMSTMRIPLVNSLTCNLVCLKDAISSERKATNLNERRLYFFVIQVLCGLFSTPASMNESILSQSKSYSEGKLSSTLLHHKSLMFVYKLYETMLDFIKNSWLYEVSLSSTEEFAKVEQAFCWFRLFCDFCKSEHTTSLSANSFSVSSLALYWKWLVDKFMVIFENTDLPDDIVLLSSQLQHLLGNDVLSDAMTAATNTIGRAFGWRFIEQPELLKKLSIAGSAIKTCTVLDESIYKLYKEVWCGFENNLMLSNKVAELQLRSEDVKKNMALCCNNHLYLLACYTALEQFQQKEIVWDSLLHYGSNNGTNINQMTLINLLKNEANLTAILPHFKLSVYSQTTSVMSAMVTSNLEATLKAEQVLIPYCASILSFIQSLTKPKSNEDGFELQISLADVKSINSSLMMLQENVWCNVTKIMCAKKTLCDALNKTARNDVIKILHGLSDVCDIQWNLSSSINDVDLNSLIEHSLSSNLPNDVIEIIHFWHDSKKKLLNNNKTDYVEAGVNFCLTGLLSAVVTRPYLNYDPAEEVSMRQQCFKDQLLQVDNELRMRYEAEFIWCGAPVPQFSHTEVCIEHYTSNPERVSILLTRRKQLVAEIENTVTEKSARPDKSQYNALFQDFQHYFGSVGKPINILTYVEDVLKCVLCDDNKINKHIYNALIDKGKLLLNSVESFIKKIQMAYPLYNDITIVPCTGLQQCHNGILILLEGIQHKMLKSKYTSGMYPSKILEYLAVMSTSTPLDNLQSFTCSNVLSLSKQIADESENVTLKGLPLSLIQFSLFYLAEYSMSTFIQFADERQTRHGLLAKVLHDYYDLWCHQKQMEFDRAAAEEAFYKYKSQVHCENKTEEEEMFEMQNQLFPTFEKDFEDLLPIDNLNQILISDSVTHKNKIEVPLKINEEVLYSFVKSIYLEKEFTLSQDVLKQAFKYVLAIFKLPEAQMCVDYERITPSILIFLASIINELSGVSPVDATQFNIYSDYNINDAKHAGDILMAFHLYLKELLNEFEEHPTLLQVESIILRLMTLSIYSPLMKFVTGFEFLLKQAQNWEAYAASHVSLRKHLEIITSQIIEWRKLELKSWPLLLERTRKKNSAAVSKYFLHFFNLIEEIRNCSLEDFSLHVENMKKSIKEFLESSSVGEFEARLEMVDMVCCHLKVNYLNEALLNDVWNTNTYYKQFLKSITQHIEERTKPIEKELKDYVKIAKWNDINFYAVKQAVDKSHRTLTKYIRKYEGVLKEPIQQFLQNSKAISNISHHASTKGFTFTITEKAMDHIVTVQLESAGNELYLNKIDRLCAKMTKHAKKICKQMSHAEIIENLDGFTGDIIEGIQELQKENILSLPKEKQKAARNNLQQRKRKALASLFKELKGLGLSYRKGLTIMESIDSSTSLPIIDAGFSANTNLISDMTELLGSCNQYFFGSIARQSAFQMALCLPSKEIGPGEILRFKGLSCQLYDLCCNQRRMMGNMLQMRNKIHHVTAGLKGAKSVQRENVLLPPQTRTREKMIRVKDLVYKAIHVLNQTKVFILSAPKTKSGYPTSPFPHEELSHAAQLTLADEEIQNAVLQLDKSCSSVEIIKDEIKLLGVDDERFPLLNWSHFEFSHERLSSLREIIYEQNEIVKLLLPSRHNNPSMAEKLIELQQEIEAAYTSFIQNQYQVNRTDMTEQVISTVESTITKLLLSVQNLVKLSNEFKGVVDKAREEDRLMLNGHLVPILSKHFFHQIKQLDLQSVTTDLDNFVSILKMAFHHESHVSSVFSQSMNLCPLLTVFENLVDYFLHILLMLHRTCCKLLFVLYGLFTDLILQGYCIPPEEEGEMSGEGATAFEDIENGGLGDGQGAKDVSEQIESEDQVEDTKHEKSEEKEDEPDEQEDIKEEKEGIEMSDDFDGKLQDLELDEDDESNSGEDEEEEEEEADKQMGEVDEQQNIVDEKMWGDSDDEDEENEEKKEEEKGQGAEGKSESQLVAKEDNGGEQEGDDADRKQPNNEQVNEQELPEDENQEEDSSNDQDEVETEQPVGDVPDDLNLDKNEQENDLKEDEMKEDEMKEDLEENKDVDQGEESLGKQDENEGAADDNDKNEMEENEKDLIESENEDETKTGSDEDRSMLSQEPTYSTENVEQVADDVEMQATSTTTEQQDQNTANEGLGQADSEGKEGRRGAQDAVSKQQTEQQRGKKRKDMQRSNEERMLEESEVNEAKKRKAIEADSNHNDDNEEASKDTETYQHIQDENVKHDQVTVDSATQEQLRRLDHSQTFSQEDMEIGDEKEDEVRGDDRMNIETKDVKADKSNVQPEDVHGEQQEETKDEGTQDEVMNSDSADAIKKDIKSEFFTAPQLLSMPLANIQEKDAAMEKLRYQLENELISLSVNKSKVTDEKSAMELWMKYESLTSTLAQQLCEQLRLVLEPTLASKMKGDYRTGKRLNMRKVIPYIASQFRKDKIWLRRTKKSKRQYQIIMAVDDSSSMAENHSKQLAFESLAVISNALRWLEAGDLAVCSFGEEARLVHSFDEPFSEHAGASVLQQFTFKQKKTKIAQLLNMCTVLLNNYKSRGQQSRDVETSQLLLIVSDGRGIFLEGKEVVKRAAQQAREAGIFIVFLILDDPKNRDSIMDIKVPIFKPGGVLPEIKSYIEEFPFPYYVLLRNINSLPNVLCDALKQWFELVTQAT